MLSDFNNEIHIADGIFVLSLRENDHVTLKNFKRYQALKTADLTIVKLTALAKFYLILITGILCSWMNVP
jgi:hypothetical protein